MTETNLYIENKVFHYSKECELLFIEKSNNSILRKKILKVSSWIAQIIRLNPFEETLFFLIEKELFEEVLKNDLELTFSDNQKELNLKTIIGNISTSIANSEKTADAAINNLDGTKKYYFKGLNKLNAENYNEQTLFFNNDFSKISSLKKGGLDVNITSYSSLFFKEILAQPIISIFEIELMTDEQKSKVVNMGGDWMYELPEIQILQQFKKIAKLKPASIAIICDNEELNYSELDILSNSFAARMVEFLSEKDTHIPVFLEKSVEFIVSVLGIVKLGKAYIPIDPRTAANHFESWKEMYPNRFYIDKQKWDEINNNKIASKEIKSVSRCHESILYTMFTSGTTGEPKAVNIPDRGILRLCIGNSSILFNNQTICLSTADVSFDAFTLELWATLLNGGKLIVSENILDLESLKKKIKKDNVNTMWLTSSFFNKIVEHNLEAIIELNALYIGGEKLSESYVREYMKSSPKTLVYNGYGPTENTTFSNCHQIKLEELEKDIPLGKAIEGSISLVLDDNQNIVPFGVVGEIYLGGQGLASSIVDYSNENNNLIQNYEIIGGKEIKLFRSGDLGSLDKNGVLHFSGRKDRQLKINGFRIESEEIEGLFTLYTEIKPARFIYDKENNGLFLFYILNNKIEANKNIESFQSELPSYLQGVICIEINHFPINKNGKIDEKELILIGSNQKKNIDIIAANNIKQEIILEAFGHALKRNINEISIESDFFEIGGNSLKAISLSAKLQNNFEIKISQIFEYKTIKNLSENLIVRELDIIESIEDQLSKTENDYSSLIEKSESLYINKVYNYKVPELKSVSFKKILITGTTGFLGAHLLAEFIRESNTVAFCIVRELNLIEPEQRLKEMLKHYFGNEFEKSFLNNRIRVIKGDITEPNLAISENIYAELVNSVDAIFNCAALVSHYGFEEDFTLTNVSAVSNILELCTKGNIGFHHMSTLTVADVSDEDFVFFTEFDSSSRIISEDNIYAKTKAISEQIVDQYIEEGGEAYIYRIGNLTSNFESGVFQKNVEENRFIQNLKTHLDLGFITNDIEGVDFTPVDKVSKAIKLLSENPSKIKKYHLSHIADENISNKLKLSLQNHYINITFADGKGYMDLLGRALKNSALSEIAENWVLLSGFLSKNKIIVLKKELTDKLLTSCQFSWGTHSQEYFDSLISHLVEVGFIQVGNKCS